MNATLDKTLILIRHAHRAIQFGRSQDNGLSKKGKQQAINLSQYFWERFGNSSALLVSSPKKRCIETLQPMARKLKRKIQLSSLLLENSQSTENHPEPLGERVHQFYRWWLKEGPSLTVVCSHGDWIPLFLMEFLQLNCDTKKASWIEINYKKGKISLVELLQQPGSKN